MRKFNRRSRRALSFRLFFVLAGALLLLAALAPSANAQNVLVYFNFEHPVGGTPDFNSVNQGAPDFNPGGGVQASVLQLVAPLANVGNVDGTLINRTVGDSDTNNPGIGLGMRTTPQDNGGGLQFHVNTTAFTNMSLSFAINTQGNGFNSVTLSYSTNGGGTFTNFGGPQFIPAGGGFTAFTFAVPIGAEGQPDVIFRLTFTGGTSQGNNLQTIIDNIQLTGVPEPTTVAGGLLGVLGLCWHQRRRLRLILPRSRRA